MFHDHHVTRIPDETHGVEKHAVEVAGQAARVTRHVQRGEQLHAKYSR